MFPVYGGKCLSCKVTHSWVKKFSQGRSKVADDARPGAEVAETTVKIFLCCGLVEDMSRNKCFFHVRISYV
jgi:hypothetical protein